MSVRTARRALQFRVIRFFNFRTPSSQLSLLGLHCTVQRRTMSGIQPLNTTKAAQRAFRVPQSCMIKANKPPAVGPYVRLAGDHDSMWMRELTTIVVPKRESWTAHLRERPGPSCCSLSLTRIVVADFDTFSSQRSQPTQAESSSKEALPTRRKLAARQSRTSCRMLAARSTRSSRYDSACLPESPVYMLELGFVASRTHVRFLVQPGIASRDLFLNH